MSYRTPPPSALPSQVLALQSEILAAKAEGLTTREVAVKFNIPTHAVRAFLQASAPPKKV